MPASLFMCGFMFISGSHASARARGECESLGCQWGDLWWGLLKRLLFSHLHTLTHTVLVFTLTAPISWLLLCALPHESHELGCILSSDCYTQLNGSDSSHRSIRGSISDNELSTRRRNQLCNDSAHRGWNHPLPQCTADVISQYSWGASVLGGVLAYPLKTIFLPYITENKQRLGSLMMPHRGTVTKLSYIMFIQLRSKLKIQWDVFRWEINTYPLLNDMKSEVVTSQMAGWGNLTGILASWFSIWM